MKNILKRNRQELILLLIILAVGGIIGGINPVFFSTPNLLDILSNMVIDGIFAFAVMLGIIIGGIDVSFPAIAVSSMYITTRVAVGADYQGPLVLLFLMSVGIGLLLGLFNGLLITTFKLPAFIVTLGTSNLFYGLLISIAVHKSTGWRLPWRHSASWRCLRSVLKAEPPLCRSFSYSCFWSWQSLPLFCAVPCWEE